MAIPAQPKANLISPHWHPECKILFFYQCRLKFLLVYILCLSFKLIDEWFTLKFITKNTAGIFSHCAFVGIWLREFCIQNCSILQFYKYCDI